MNSIMTCFLSPLNPLKGRFAAKLNQSLLATITPSRGLGVNKWHNKFFHNINLSY
jgi:hypothetical protein